MQYTGLKDKNGKEIYEGDILDNRQDDYLPVRMDSSDNSDGFYYADWLGWMANHSSLYDIHDNSEIIGNKYENPELLKETT